MPPWERPLYSEPPRVMVYLLLKSEQRYYEISKRDLGQDEWGRELLATKLDGTWIDIDDFNTATLGYYILWLKNKRLEPFQDFSWPFKGRERRRKDVALGRDEILKRNYATICQYNSSRPSISMVDLSDTRNDDNPSEMLMARRLLNAYFVGQDLKARYFQDAVMNTIVEHFSPDCSIPVSLVEEVYRRSTPKLSGLRRFLVDYYVWGSLPPTESDLPALCVSNSLPKMCLAPLCDYPEAFMIDVTAALQDVRTEMTSSRHPRCHRRVSSDPHPPKYRDDEIDFLNLSSFLRNAKGGNLRCRYHMHTRMEICFNLLV